MAPPRRPLRDNPRLILAGMIVLLAALVGIVALANRSAGLSPDFLTEFVLYGLWAADLTILLGLDVRARAQRHQADRRAAAGAAVRAIPRKARRGAARHDADPCGARAARRQRADPEQRRSLVQRACRGSADVRRSDRERLLPRSAGSRHGRRAAPRRSPGGRRVRRRRRRGCPRSHPSGGDAGAREDGRGVSRHAGHAASRGDAVCRRRRARHAARLCARGRRSHGGAGGVRADRTADARAIADGRRADSRGRGRAARRLSRRRSRSSSRAIF